MGNATAGEVRLLRVEDFADRAEARFAELFGKAREEGVRGRFVVCFYFAPRIDERPDEPGPDCALMISGVARAQITVVGRLVIRVLRRKRTQAKRREQFALHDIHDGGPSRRREHGMIERDGEDLIGPAGGIVAAFKGVDHIKEVTAFFKPEAFVKRLLRAIGVFRVTLGHFVLAHFTQPTFQKLERIKPERVNFHRFPAPRRDDPLAHLRVHPGELRACESLHEQAVREIEMDIEFRPADMRFHDFQQRRQEELERDLIVRLRQVAAQSVKEPQGRVRGVIEALVLSIGEHVRDQTILHIMGEGAQDVARFHEPAGGES